MRSFSPYTEWKVLLRDRKFRASLFIGVILMLSALEINFLATQYVTSLKEAVPVKDLILDYIPTLNLNFFYVTGIFIIISALILYPVLFRPELVPFALKTYAFFIIIRSFFISLTHIAAPADYYTYAGPSDGTPVLVSFFFLNDLFFSAHTGIPFLAFLIFHDENKFLRYFFLISSFLMALTVLFMHVHYSIDVFSAYFITYSIYKVSDAIFNPINSRFKRIVQRIYLERDRIRLFISRKLKKKFKIQKSKFNSKFKIF